MKLYCNHVFSWTDPKYNIEILKLKRKVNAIGFGNYYKKYEEYCKQYVTSGFSKVSLISWKWDKRYLRNKEWYSDTIFLPFEDMMIPVPNGYHMVLTTQFGDYMKPVKTPTMHGGFIVLDPDSSYKNYLTLLRKKTKKETCRNRIKKIKRFFHIFPS